MRAMGTCLALMGALGIGLAASGSAADPATDTITAYGVAQPQGPVSASYLRMHHSLYLLDQCRKVKAGTVVRKRVEPLVGRTVLDTLLTRDLDALYLRLTGPASAPPTGGAPVRSLWDRILTDDGAAPAPPLDLPAALDFHDVGQGDSPTRILHVTAPADGLIEATLPPESPYRILSIQTNTGVIAQLGALPRRPIPVLFDEGAANPRGPSEPESPPIERARSYRVPELAKQELPAQLPVQAGQDVDIEVGLPVTAAVPPGGLSSILTVGDPVEAVWRQDVALLAQPALKGDIKIIIGTPQPFIDLVDDLSYFPNVPYNFVVPVTVANPNPPVKVQGIIQPDSLPPGVSMQNIAFILQPNQTLNLSVPVSIDRNSPAWSWQQEEIPQAFSFRVSYHTTSIPLASRQEVADFSFTKYPPTQTWQVVGKPGGVDCKQDVIVYSTGWTVRSGECENRNAYTANVAVFGTLASVNAVQHSFSLGWLDHKNVYYAFTVSPFQTNYVYVRGQPLLMSWKKN
jgi:hypothetical protein